MIQVPDLTASSVAAYVAIDTYRCPGGYGFMAGLDFGVDSLDGENVSNYKGKKFHVCTNHVTHHFCL